MFCRLSRVITPLGERVFENGMDGRLAAGLETYLEGVRLNQGSQIIRVPEGSRISDLCLSGGASFRSNWAALRGSVLKFFVDRAGRPVTIRGKGWTVPAGHSLMDEESLRYAIEDRNKGVSFPYLQVKAIDASEPMFMVHFTFAHPDQLFLPQGRFMGTTFFHNEPGGADISGAFRTNEISLNYPGSSIDILSMYGITTDRILVTLAEGGRMLLEDL